MRSSGFSTRAAALAAALVFSAPLVVLGQVALSGDAISPALRGALAADTLGQEAAERLPDGRRSTRTGLMQTRYFTGHARPALPDAILRSEAAAFGLEPDLRDVRETDVQRSLHASHHTYQQHVGGVPVFEARLHLSRDAEGRATKLTSSYVPEIADRAEGLALRPTLDAAEATDRAEAVLRDAYGTARTRGAARLVIVPSAAPRLAWETTLVTPGLAAAWRALVCAHTGDLLLLRDELRRRKPHAVGRATQDAATASTQSALQTTVVSAPLLPVATPTGAVFDPDPLASSGQSYGGFYTDGFSDRDTDQLNAERVTVDLLGVTESGGMYRLTGPHVQVSEIDPFDIALDYSPPVQASPSFDFPRSDQHFEAVNVYVHIDRAQRYIQTLNIGRDMVNRPLSVNPHGYGNDDNSAYDPGSRSLVFGDGGVDDAEDASVIWHEYGHALLDDVAPDLGFTNEMSALHEGWSDYFASSYQRWLLAEGVLKRDDWQQVFRWDAGDGALWDGRKLDAVGKYPEDTGCDSDGKGGFCDIYADGVLWATTLMGLQDRLGRATTDRLVVISLGYLNGATTFTDAAEALVQADTDVFGATNRNAIIEHMISAGYLPGGFVSVEQAEATATATSAFLPAAPNPFASGTTLRFQLGASARVTLGVYDVLGRRIAEVLSAAPHGPGTHTAPLDASHLPAGVYFARLDAEGQPAQTQRLVLVR